MNQHTARPQSPRQRFFAKIERHAGCWLWTAARHRAGYGKFTPGPSGEWVLAHRAAYEMFVGPIPDGQELHHTCENKGCVNPAHLVALTRLEHARLSDAAQATHCINGHPYDEENTYIRTTGQRDCRACTRERARRYRERKRIAA